MNLKKTTKNIENIKEITQSAKKIMDDFMKELDNIPEIKNYGLERKDFLREPKDKKQDKEFKKLMLNNAPKIKEDCIQAEKKTW